MVDSRPPRLACRMACTAGLVPGTTCSRCGCQQLRVRRVGSKQAAGISPAALSSSTRRCLALGGSAILCWCLCSLNAHLPWPVLAKARCLP